VHDSAIDRLRGLLDVAAAVRTGGELRSVLEAVADAIAGPLGYGAVVINLYRPAWDDFEVVVVLGNEESQALLMGQTSGMEDWAGLLTDRFLRDGTYFVRAGEYDWDDENVLSYTPAIEISDDPDAWHPDDALMVPLRSADGALLGIVSVDEPVTGRRPTQVGLELLSTVVAYAAVAVEQAQAAELGRRHRAAVEHLLAVSAQLTERRTAEEVLDAVCWGTREALGFHKVVAFLAEEGRLVPLSGVGFTEERAAEFPRVPVDVLERLVDERYMRHGCIVMEREEAVVRAPEFGGVYSSVSNGRGALAWNHHWVVVPLHDSQGRLDGMMWVDDPKDRLLPSDEALQALRVFANQAMGAIESARRLDRLEHLAAHDPLTGLRNRRGFEESIEAHLARLGADGDLSLLVIDIDHFKRINDSLGHDTGDAVLRHFAEVLRTACAHGPEGHERAGMARGARPAGVPDVPTRLGGEEFALVLPGAGEAAALTVAEHVRLLVRGEFASFANPVSVSVGVASRGPEARDAGALMRAANRALYAAKRLGRDRCVVHHEQTLEMLDALRDAEGGSGAEQLAAAMLLAETLDLRDVATARHSETVGRYCEQIARELGFPAPQIERVRAAGILHDIGKLGIADAILHKPGRLDTGEWAEIRRHPELGSRILEHANLRDISGWVLHHHERVDGAGYPHALAGVAIPLEARILAVADAYEAMTSDRPYRDALSVATARAELRRGAGSQFDREVVAAFEKVLDRASFVATTGEPHREAARLPVATRSARTAGRPASRA
jgi:HD-GYP domain-containing protein (c-di-GMP phosphodiesterase class II)/GAF domain-containing protein